MRLVFSTKDLVLMGRPVVGLPILLDDDMQPLEPAQSFITHLLLERHGADSPLTWEDYGRRLYDFFAFLHANELAWNEKARAPGLSVVARYVNADLKLTHFFLNCRFKSDTPPLNLHTAYALGAVSRLLFTIPAAR